jgi:hypothetical protein
LSSADSTLCVSTCGGPVLVGGHVKGGGLFETERANPNSAAAIKYCSLNMIIVVSVIAVILSIYLNS